MHKRLINVVKRLELFLGLLQTKKKKEKMVKPLKSEL
jgi:hypothetical protein